MLVASNLDESAKRVPDKNRDMIARRCPRQDVFGAFYPPIGEIFSETSIEVGPIEE
jgi:hypothetical protein